MVMLLRRGFTLVELSIVLVIVGLVVGGVMVGQHMVRQGEFMSVYTDYEKFRSAARQFKSSYGGLPGDISDAQNIWGAAAACPGTLGTTTPGTGTCNGNGNGLLESRSSNGGLSDEPFTFWQHLVLAGLLEGAYTGIAGPASDTDAVNGVSSPTSRIANAGYSMMGAHYLLP